MGVPRIFVAAAAATALWGCGFHGQRSDWKDVLPPTKPAPLLSDGTTPVAYEKLFEYTLGEGDTVNVEIVGHKEFSGLANVDERGKLAVANSGKIIEVSGLTLPQTQGRVAQAVAQYVVGDPDVRVSLVASRSKSYYILGGVWHPGLYSMGAGIVRLREAIAAAGLFREYRADESRVGVITPDPVRPTYVIVNAHDVMMGEDKHNIIIKSGDVIFVQDKIIYDVDGFVYTLFRETENTSTANKAVKFWEGAKEGNFGDFSYPRQGVTLIY